MKEFDQLKEYSFTGDFYMPDRRDERIPGTLNYSLEAGLHLKVIFGRNSTLKDFDYDKWDGTIWGEVDTIGAVSIKLTDKSGFRYPTLPLVTGDTETSVNYLVSGIHAHLSELDIDSLSFSLTNLTNFCAPHGVDLMPYTEEPLIEATSNDIKIDLRMFGSGKLAYDFVNNSLMISNDELKEELSEMLKKIKEKYPKEFIAIRNKLEFKFAVKASSLWVPLKLQRALLETWNLGNFLSILVQNNCISTKTNIRIGKKQYLVLKGYALTTRMAENIRKPKEFPYIPVTLKGISNFNKTISEWNIFNLPKTNLLREFFFNMKSLTSSPMQNYLIGIATVKQIMLQEGYKGDGYFDEFLSRYSNEQINDKINDNLPVIEQKTIGYKAQELRNCIIHPQKVLQKKYEVFEPFMDITNLGNLTECILATSLHYLYIKLEIKEEQLKNYTERISMFMLNYRKIPRQ